MTECSSGDGRQAAEHGYCVDCLNDFAICEHADLKVKDQ